MSAKRKTNTKPKTSRNKTTDESGQVYVIHFGREEGSGVSVRSRRCPARPRASGGPSAAPESSRNILAPETGSNERVSWVNRPLGQVLGRLVRPGSRVFRYVYDKKPIRLSAEWDRSEDVLGTLLDHWKSFVRGDVKNLGGPAI